MPFSAPAINHEKPFVLPTLRSDGSVLWAYDGAPGEGPWERDFSEYLQMVSTNNTNASTDWVREEVGFPVGPYQATSERVSRCCGAVHHPDQEHSADALIAAGIAQGRLIAGWFTNEDGLFLQVEVFSPEFIALKGNCDFLVRQQLEVRCLKQSLEQITSLVSGVAHLGMAQGVQFLWQGEWDESTHIFRKKMVERAMAAWLVARATAIEADLAF